VCPSTAEAGYHTLDVADRTCAVATAIRPGLLE
jgi:hypothetical protein